MLAVGTCRLDRGLGWLGRGFGRRAPGGEPLCPRARCVLTCEPAVDLDEVVDAEIPPRLRGCTGEGQVTVPGQEDNVVTLMDGRRLVGGEDHRDTLASELAQQSHDLRRRRRVKTRSGFIQE